MRKVDRLVRFLALTAIILFTACDSGPANAQAGDTGGDQATPAGNASSFVWMEAEKPDSTPEIAPPPDRPDDRGFRAAGWGKTHLLSEGTLLDMNIPANQIESRIPKDGAVFGYNFEIKSAGDHEVWARVGMENVRADFDWRLDDGEWTRIAAAENPTTDLYEFNRWNSIGWLRLTEADLQSGKHVLQIRLPITYSEDREGNKKPNRIIFNADAFCIYKGTWRPNGKHKPGADWQTDEDRVAASHVFTMPAPAPFGQRTVMELNGTWQYARFDEMGWVEDPYGPVTAPPAADTLYWHAFEVPGNRNNQMPDMFHCHRYFLRTRLNVPAEYTGKRFLLDFDETNFIATVYVNGQRMGFSDAVCSPMTVDVTDAVTPGQVNEVWVGIKDAYYGLSPSNPETGNIRSDFGLPGEYISGNQGVTMRFLYPLKGAERNGITDKVRVIATGNVYVDDVYAIPSVKDKALKLQVTLNNPGADAVNVTIENEVEPLNGGPVELTLPAATANIAAGAPGQAVVNVTAPWENPRLWWPDDPHQYNVVTRVKVDGKVVDTARTKFGFREWSIEGPRFVLNGVPWQFRADLMYYGCPVGEEDKAVETWKRTGQNMFRLRFQHPWAGMSQNEVLDFMDENGVPVRRNVGTFDGQHASYRLAEMEGRGDDRKKVANTVLFDNWRKQVAARVKKQRNHPCVFVWELDNEIIYINARNFGNLDVAEPEFAKTAKLIESLDMQGRGQMVAGGRALMNQDLPVNGAHYEAIDTRHYPDESYGLGLWTEQSSKQPWPMAKDRPIFLSEEYFAHGINPSGFAAAGGEVCFAGRAACKDAVSLLARMYSEGYRWQALGGFHYWFSKIGNGSQYNIWQPVCALVREWNWTFGAGSTVQRTVMVRNDTRYDDPITLEWQCTVNGNVVADDRRALQVEPGQGSIVELSLAMPRVQDDADGELVLSCYRKGEKIWTESKPLRVIDPNGAPAPRMAAGKLAVFDPQGQVKQRLRQRGVAFTDVAALDQLPEGFEILIVGKDAITTRQSTDSMWLALAAQNKRILVLDQENPLHYQAVPADFEVTDYVGRIAFSEDLTHPVFNGLTQQDFFCWSGDHVVYRNVYRKASQGARSLAQCDNSLGYSAIAECRVNEGLMLLCQMVVTDKLATDPVAARLFDNMVNYAVGYERIRNVTAANLPAGDPRRKLLDRSGLQYQDATDPVAAMADADVDIVIADATPATLAQLAGGNAFVKAFTDRGGWLMLWNVTPDGLDSFNDLVGVEHIMRPFRIERVTLAAQRDPLSAGMSQRDFTLYSGRRIFGFQGIEYVVGDMFQHVVDLHNIAPFLEGPGIGTPDPNRPSSVVNGFTSVEAWKYIWYMNIPEDGSKAKLDYQLPRRETITGFSVVPNAHYNLTTKFKLVPDDDESRAQVVELQEYDGDNNPRQDFAIEPMECEKLSIVCEEVKMVAEGKPTGIDNLWINVARSDEFNEKVHPLLNIGGLNRYPMGEGGIILNQLNVNESESVPVNEEKKAAIVSGVLANLNATFEGGQLLVAGAGLKYNPVSLEGKCNLYITADRGWHDPEHDFAHLPLGTQRFQGVTYEIRDFKTSPLENAITLQGFPQTKADREVKDIAVNAEADVLFFLHAFNRTREWTPRRATDEPPVIFQYVVHYADGKTETVDVKYGLGADHWMQDEPKGLRDAAIAWAAPFVKDETKQAALYQMQWNNPHPDVEIKSIDVQYAEGVGNRWGQPLVFAITTATALD